MSGINLQKVAHSFTRSILLNAGKKIHSSSSDLEQQDTDDETPAQTPGIQKNHSGILDIASR